MTSKKLSALILTLALILVSAGSSFAAFANRDNPIIPIVKRASVAVVNIDVEKTAKRSISPFPFDDDPFFKRFFGDSFKDFTKSVPMKGRGSGFIVTKDGQILTNNHVVDGVDKITVSLQLADGDKKTYPAKIVGNDPTYDLAVIKIEPDETLPVLELGDSDAVEVGEYVVAIGNPYGFEHTVTAGVISAKNRSVHAQDVNFDDFLQTDAAINPGNSGGPLLDMDGKVIGINTAIIPYAQGMGFAIPVNKAKEIMSDLVSYGRVKRGWLGVTVTDISDETAKVYGVEDSKGAMIIDVVKGDPADKAGIKRGDVVVELNGEKVKDSSAFVNRVRTLAPNSTAKLKVMRGRKPRTISVKLGERPASADGRTDTGNNGTKSAPKSGSSDVLKDFGISGVAQVNDELRRQYKIDAESEGLVVTDVEKDSPAEENGVTEGDLILQINADAVKTAEDASKAIGDYDFVILMIKRGNATPIIIKVDKAKK